MACIGLRLLELCGVFVMNLTELIPIVSALPLADKLKLMRILVEDLETKNANEDIFPFEPFKVYYLPTPYETYGAAKFFAEDDEEGNS